MLAAPLAAGVVADALAADGAAAIAQQGVRTEARNLAEKLTLDEAKAGAGERIMQGKINDPNFPEDAWAKMQHVHTTPDGENIVVHYWKSLVDGIQTGFKFKN